MKIEKECEDLMTPIERKRQFKKVRGDRVMAMPFYQRV